MQVHIFRRPSAEYQQHWFYLCSDLHLGSPECDLKRLRRDLDDARAANARILVNGDVFDAIDCRDKRWTPTAIVPELRSSRALAQDVVGYAAKILEPYADLCDIIGIGNHEEKWIGWNAFDPVTLLIERLNSALDKQGSAHRVKHGGICGFWRNIFEREEKKLSVTHDLFYFHGAGGDSPVTLGTIDMQRKSTSFLYDCITFGHKHNKLIKDDVLCELSTTGKLRYKQRKAIQTGSYYRNYQVKEDPLDYSYATSKAHNPKPMGGRFLILTPERTRTGENQSSLWTVRQDDASTYLGSSNIPPAQSVLATPTQPATT